MGRIFAPGRASSRALGLALGVAVASCAAPFVRTRSSRIEPSSLQPPLPSLRGTVGGVAWQARSALAHPGLTDAPERYVLIYPFEWTCDDAAASRSGRGDEHFVSVFVPWRDGVRISPPDGTFDEERLSRSGELTLLYAAPRHGAVGRLRLEMAGDDPAHDRVAGEIDVVDCAPLSTALPRSALVASLAETTRAVRASP
jgi:hypothetical protein